MYGYSVIHSTLRLLCTYPYVPGAPGLLPEMVKRYGDAKRVIDRKQALCQILILAEDVYLKLHS